MISLLWWEGAFAFAYDTLVGPVYISGLAGEVGISIWLVSLLTSLPWLGQSGQLVGAFFFGRVQSLKKYTLVLAALSRSLWLLPLVTAGWFGFSQYAWGVAFPVRGWFVFVSVIACLSTLAGHASLVGWLSWMKAVIPSNFQGRFFGGRQRYYMAALILANLAAAAWVGWKPGGYRTGYAVVCLLALMAALLSTLFLARVPDAVRFETQRPFLESVMEPLRDAGFRRVILFGTVFQGAVLLAGTYFPYYFTKELGIPMSYIAVWAMLANLGNALSSAFWGRMVDRSGNPGRAIFLGGIMMACSPLLYIIPSAKVVMTLGLAEAFMSGVAWAGYNLAMTTLIFKTCPKGRNAAYFGVYAACSGIAGAACIFIGGALAKGLVAYGGFRALWLVASAARFAVILTLGRALR